MSALAACFAVVAPGVQIACKEDREQVFKEVSFRYCDLADSLSHRDNFTVTIEISAIFLLGEGIDGFILSTGQRDR